jgi:hypothetical protein
VNKINIQIKAKEYALLPRTDLEEWLDVKWTIENLEKYDCYILSKGFLSVSMNDFLLIDHTTSSESYKIDAQIDPVTKFEKVKSGDSIILEYHYPLPHINDIKFKEVKVVGKFSVSQAKPNPEWTKASYWESIKAWENAIFSLEFKINTRPHN